MGQLSKGDGRDRVPHCRTQSPTAITNDGRECLMPVCPQQHQTTHAKYSKKTHADLHLRKLGDSHPEVFLYFLFSFPFTFTAKFKRKLMRN